MFWFCFYCTNPPFVVVGVIVAVVVSLFQVVYRSTKPTSAVLGRLPGTIVYKDVDFFPNAETIDGVLVLK